MIKDKLSDAEFEEIWASKTKGIPKTVKKTFYIYEGKTYPTRVAICRAHGMRPDEARKVSKKVVKEVKL